MPTADAAMTDVTSSDLGARNTVKLENWGLTLSKDKNSAVKFFGSIT